MKAALRLLSLKSSPAAAGGGVAAAGAILQRAKRRPTNSALQNSALARWRAPRAPPPLALLPGGSTRPVGTVGGPSAPNTPASDAALCAARCGHLSVTNQKNTCQID